MFVAGNWSRGSIHHHHRPDRDIQSAATIDPGHGRPLDVAGRLGNDPGQHGSALDHVWCVGIASYLR